MRTIVRVKLLTCVCPIVDAGRHAASAYGFQHFGLEELHGALSLSAYCWQWLVPEGLRDRGLSAARREWKPIDGDKPAMAKLGQ